MRESRGLAHEPVHGFMVGLRPFIVAAQSLFFLTFLPKVVPGLLIDETTGRDSPGLQV